MPPEPLRIAFATPEYVTENYFDGGLANHIHRVAKALAALGHDIHVLTLSEIDEAEFEHEEQYPDAYAALVGRDMESSLAPSMAVYARAQCGRSAERLVLLDKLPHRQLYPVIAGAHLVVLPSLIENFPNVCLESMGLGKVVIGTAGTSFEEIISEGATGFLVSPNNPEALAEKIISAWIHPKLEEMGAAARQQTLEFAPEKTVATLLTYYREILSG